MHAKMKHDSMKLNLG